jgi:hypothetical protein
VRELRSGKAVPIVGVARFLKLSCFRDEALDFVLADGVDDVVIYCRLRFPLIFLLQATRKVAAMTCRCAQPGLPPPVLQCRCVADWVEPEKDRRDNKALENEQPKLLAS